MTVQDITPDTVLAAVQAGHDDYIKLADHFSVTEDARELYRNVAALIESDRLVLANPEGWATEAARWVVA